MLALLVGLSAGCLERPSAEGLPGQLEVYAQGPQGPFQLSPRQMHRLYAPQKLAFRWVPGGAGPRIIHIRVIPDAASPELVHEARLEPGPARYLEWLLELDERAPARFRLETEVVSPHDQPIQTRYGIELRPTPSTGVESPP